MFDWRTRNLSIAPDALRWMTLFAPSSNSQLALAVLTGASSRLRRNRVSTRPRSGSVSSRSGPSVLVVLLATPSDALKVDRPRLSSADADPSGNTRPRKSRNSDASTDPASPPTSASTRFSTCGRPAYSAPNRSPRPTSTRSTRAAGMRCSSTASPSRLFDGRWPLKTTLPAAWPKPRVVSDPTSSVKPGMRWTIWSALIGWNRPKNAWS